MRSHQYIFRTFSAGRFNSALLSKLMLSFTILLLFDVRQMSPGTDKYMILVAIVLLFFFGWQKELLLYSNHLQYKTHILFGLLSWNKKIPLQEIIEIKVSGHYDKAPNFFYSLARVFINNRRSKNTIVIKRLASNTVVIFAKIELSRLKEITNYIQENSTHIEVIYTE